MVIRADLSSKLLASIVGCLTAEYSSWMTGVQKSYIVSHSRGTSIVNSWLSAPLNLSSAISAISTLLTLLIPLSVLSISVCNGNNSAFYFLCMN